MADNLRLSLIIGAALGGGFRKTFGAARESVEQLSKTARRAENDVGRRRVSLSPAAARPFAGALNWSFSATRPAGFRSDAMLCCPRVSLDHAARPDSRLRRERLDGRRRSARPR